GEHAEGGGQSLLAVQALLLDGGEGRGSGHGELGHGCPLHGDDGAMGVPPSLGRRPMAAPGREVRRRCANEAYELRRASITTLPTAWSCQAWRWSSHRGHNTSATPGSTQAR